jgi:very-short-patch-repair endonuclease
VPQVYLHYDPLTVRQRLEGAALPRQRMDFLLLFSPQERVVIEIDGKQHYADGDTASPARYAKMVAADRELRLGGYEVYRFGGLELLGPGADGLIDAFVEKLFVRYRVTMR